MHRILGSFNSLKVLFHLSLTVLFTIGYWMVLGWRVDPPLLYTQQNSVFRCLPH
jgi:hypothetical protein